MAIKSILTSQEDFTGEFPVMYSNSILLKKYYLSNPIPLNTVQVFFFTWGFFLQNRFHRFYGRWQHFFRTP
jgi:hypothetical protein